MKHYPFTHILPRLFLGMLWLVFGCAPISPELVRQSDPSLNFAALQDHPEAYLDRMVVLGGEVISVTMANGGSLLQVHQKDLDSRQRPVDAPRYGGTFLVLSDQWLPPDAYIRDRKVTVAGVVLGRREGMPYLQARKIYLWEDPRRLEDLLKEWFKPELHYWYTPPYFDPWRPGGRP